MRKFQRTMIALLALSIVLMGCSVNKSGEEALKNSGNSKENGNKEELTISVLRPEHPSQPLREDAPSLQQIEKVKGVKIELKSTPLSDYETKKKTLISTNRLPDATFMDLKDIRDNASSGILLDLTPYMDKMPNLKKALEKYPEFNKVLVDGKLYGFPNLDRKAMYYGQLPMIRADILKKLNIQTPTSFDELYQALKKMKAANPDSYPWTMRWGIVSQIGYLAYAFGSGYGTYYEPTSDKYQYGPLYPEFKSMLVYLKKLYDEKLLDPNYATNTAQQWQQNLSSGKSFFFYDNNQFGVNFIGALQQKDPQATFDMLPVLKNEKGQRRNYMYPVGHLGSFYAISSKVKNPDKIVEFFDWLYSEEGADITNYGIPGEHFTRTKDGVKIKPELINQFKDKAEPAWALLTYLGTGFQGFGPYADQTVFQDVSEQMTAWGNFVKEQADQGLIQPTKLQPPFTPEEAEKLKQITPKVETLISQNMDKFIMGDRPLSDYDKFVKELADAGAKELEVIYNTAYDRVRK